MKLSAKPISSPGRAEKYPPPLMRFLRSNVGSRSRSRSRSSPMFVLRKKSAPIETQEPSSPKVTCMGQVRVRRSKQPGKRSGAPAKRWCKWIKSAWFCHHFDRKIKLKPFRPVWRKWAMFCRMSFGSKNGTGGESSKTESQFGNKKDEFVQEDDQEEKAEAAAAKAFVSSSSTPPRNALLLTRCRSVPYRSSSLASRFWGSPFASEETEQEQEEPKTDVQNGGEENPTSGRESICRDTDQESGTDPENDEKLRFFKEFDGSIEKIRERFMKSEEGKTEEVVTVRPLILTRCKSEPARTREKLDPDVVFWNKRRLGFT